MSYWIPYPRFEMPELLIPNSAPHGRVKLQKYKDYALWMYGEPQYRLLEYNQRWDMTENGTVNWAGYDGGALDFTTRDETNNLSTPYKSEFRDTELTCITRFRADDATLSPYGGYMHGQSDAGTGSIDYAVAVNSGEIRVLWGTSPYLFHDTTGTQVTANKWYNVVTRRSGSSGSWTSDIWINNINFNTTTSVNGHTSDIPFRIGTIGTVGVSFEGYIALVLYIFEALPDAECFELQQNPYKLFEPL